MSETTEEPTLIRPAITATPFVVTGRLLDQVEEIGQPFAQAFSLRRIYTGYTGPCMRVRRSSDSVEIDIGFVQTVLDIDLLERHCAGFDGFVSVWYDQTGRGRHARQPVWSNQPQIVRGGTVLRDALGNFAMEFNNSFFDTEWEPTAEEVGEATGVMVVGSAGLGGQGQVGTIEFQEIDPQTPVDPDTMPEYPNEKVPQGYDTFLLDSKELSETPSERKLVYHGKDKKVYIYDTTTNTIEETGAEPPQGATLVSAELVRANGEETSDNDARANAPAANVAWGKAVEGKDGKIYGIPMRANRILCIDPSKDDPNDQATLLDIVQETRDEPDKWFTGVYSDETGCIVCPPYNPVDGEARWLIIDTDPDRTDTYQASKFVGQGSGSNLYKGVDKDSTGRVYAAPFNTSTVARLDLSSVIDYDGINDTLLETRNLPGTDRRGSSELFSDIVCAGNDRFYMTPWDAGTVVEIEPDQDMQNDARRARGNFGIELEMGSSGEGYFEAPQVRLGNPELFTDGVSTSGDFSELTVGTTLSLTRFGYNPISINNQGSGFLGTTNPSSTGSANVSFAMGPRTIDGVYRGYGLATITLNNMENRISSLSRSFFGGKGRDAVLRAARDETDPQGRILTIEVVDGGSGYFYGPYPGDAEEYGIAVEIDPPYAGAPSSQIARAEIASWIQVNENEDPEAPPSGWRIEEVILTQAGENYTRTPNVRLVGDLRGEGISVSIPTAQDHHIQLVTIDDGGDGFRVEPEYSEQDSYWSGNNQVLTVDHPNTTLSLSGGTRAILRVSKIIDGNGTIIDDPNDTTRGSIHEIQVVESGRGYHPSISPANISVNTNDFYNGSGAPTLTALLRAHGTITSIDSIDVSNIPDLGYLYPPVLSEVPGSRRIGSTSSASYVSRLRLSSDEPTTQKWTGAIYSEQRAVVTAAPYDAQRVYLIRNTGDGGDAPVFEFLNDSEGSVAKIEGTAKFSDIELNTSGQFAFTAPSGSRRVLRMDLDQSIAEFVGPNIRGVYSSFVRTQAGILYGFPSISLDVLVIDPTNVNDIDELRFGNLNFPGRKFSSALVSTQGLIYAVPDQIPVSLELNPGVPLPRSPSLPPPYVVFRVEVFVNEYHAVVYAPTPEQTSPSLRVVVLDSGPGSWSYETIDFPISKPTAKEIPWLGEGVVVENDPNPLIVFTPFYNVNSEFTWSNQNNVLLVSLNDVKSQVQSYLEALVNQTTPSIGSIEYWWSSSIPRELAPPFPARTVVPIPNLGPTVVGWVPIGAGADSETNTESFVTYVSKTNASDETPDQLLTSRGNHFGNVGSANPEGTRETERVSWATVGITDPESETRGSHVTVSYEAPSRANDAPGIQANLRNRHTRGVYVNGKVYAAPRGRNEFVIYEVETGTTTTQNWASEFSGLGFQSSNSPRRRRSNSGTNRYSDVVFFPQTNEIYAIPENARSFTVFPLDTEDRYSFGQFELVEETGTSNARFSMGAVTPNDRIACLPMNHNKIVLIDPTQANFLERLDFSLEYPIPDGWTMDFSSSTNWYRYAITIGNYLYCIPWSASQILRIDAANRTAEFVGDILNGAWGQAARHPNGRVYCAPVNTGDILSFYEDSNGDIVTELISPDLPFADGRLEGAMLGADDLIYFTHRSSGRSVVVFDPITTIVSLVGNFRNGAWQERSERHQNLVKLEDGRMLAVPITLRVFGEIVPNSALIRTYDVRNQIGNFAGRKWITEPLFVQRQYRLSPKRIERPRFGADPLPFLVFVNERGYGIYDLGSPLDDVVVPPVLSFSPTFKDGLTGLFANSEESQDLKTVVFRTNGSETEYQRIDARMLDGVITGIRSESGDANLYMGIERNDWVSYIGDGEIRVRGMFSVVFGDRETGVFSVFARGGRDNQVPAVGQLTTFIRGVSLGQRTYTWDGNASGGSTFEIGRVFQPESVSVSSGFIGTFTGNIQELVVFQSNQLPLVRTLAENQTFAYSV